MTPRMDEDRDETTRRLFRFALEIVSLLSGEDYTIVRKTPGGGVTPIIHLQESGGRSPGPITAPPPHSLLHERNKKILELSNKMIELLSGEVPIRCQDVAVYLSMEEWEYLEGHQDRYQEVMMEELRPLTPRGNPCENNGLSLNCKKEDIGKHCNDENLITLHEPPGLHSTSLSCNPLNHEEPSPEQSRIVTTIPGDKADARFQCDKQLAKCSVFLTQRKHKGEKPYSCPECGKCFIDKSALVKHERTHTGETPYSCSLCEKCFKDNSNLVQHEKSHSKEKPYSCLECGKSFTYKASLSRHQRIHTGVKPFTCSECGKCFRDKGNLITHQRIHTGVKPYTCSECGKCFIDKGNLLIHLRIHTGEKPFSCLECGKCFTDKSAIVKHERTHTGEKPYSCSFCEKCFTNKSNLVQHEKSHSEEKPYACSECGKFFKHKSCLVKHERRHTGNKL
ncbi:uncharacterized protein LOC143793564 isoform X2 [Ranitomeya variabilis]|uniref:uncharacterized protein LOC143793564 isoform X2 n=1 Tax=Ranitomeya variabilis TaxID=490064 RepID=UPI004056CED0